MKRSLCAFAAAATMLWAASTSVAAGTSQAHDQAALFAKVERTDAVIEGPATTRHVLYVFFDANCLYCHLTWKALQPYEAVGLQVRWIAVAYQQPSSAGRAAAILEAPDRVAALRLNETRYDASRFDGGITPNADVPKSLAAQLAANTALMHAFGAPGTPLLVWKAPNGTIRYRIGVPRLSELPSITGLPKQSIDDPELAAFR